MNKKSRSNRPSTTDSDYQRTVISPGDAISRFAHQVCIGSFGNCKAIDVVPLQQGNFRGLAGYRLKKHILKDMLDNCATPNDSYLEVPQNDGAGGKPQFFTLVNEKRHWENLAWEILTMVGDDLGARMCLPMILTNQIDFKQVTDSNIQSAKAILRGFKRALRETSIVNMTGETAIMRHSTTAFCDLNLPNQLVMTWAGSGIGLSHGRRYIDGSTIRPMMLIIALLESGYRCNGGTFFTKLLLAKYGSVEAILNSPEALSFVRSLVVPSKYYSHSLCRIGGWLPDGGLTKPLAKIHGIAHITGGGVFGKFPEILPEGVCAVLDQMPEPPKVLLQAQAWSEEFPELQMSDYGAYSDLNGGVGMLAVVEPGDAEQFMCELANDGISSQIVGLTGHDRGKPNQRVQIRSQFASRDWVTGPK